MTPLQCKVLTLETTGTPSKTIIKADGQALRHVKSIDIAIDLEHCAVNITQAEKEDGPVVMRQVKFDQFNITGG